MRKPVLLVLSLLLFVPVIKAQTSDPEPAPPGTLLVLRTCRAAAFKGGFASPGKDVPSSMAEKYNPSTCTDFNAMDILIPGEYRTFIHLIGPTDEYTVSCLGKISYSGWAGHYNVSKDCVFPDDYETRNVAVGTNPYEWGKAVFALPAIGSYVPAQWSKDKKKLTINFARNCGPS